MGIADWAGATVAQACIYRLDWRIDEAAFDRLNATRAQNKFGLKATVDARFWSVLQREEDGKIIIEVTPKTEENQ
jgi:hypothetical protein